MTAPLVLTWLRAVRDTKISRSAKALAGVLVTYANPDGTSCRPGDDRLRDDLPDDRGRRLTERTLRQMRGELVEAGLLICAERGRGPGRGRRGGRAADWHLILPKNTVFPEHGAKPENTVLPEQGLSENTVLPRQKTLGSGSTPTSSEDLPNRSTAGVGLKGSGNQHVSLSRVDAAIAERLPDATAAEREKILDFVRTNCQVRTSIVAYIRAWPDGDLQALHDKIRSATTVNGDGRQTSACRNGQHSGCGFDWCTCICHLGRPQ